MRVGGARCQGPPSIWHDRPCHGLGLRANAWFPSGCRPPAETTQTSSGSKAGRPSQPGHYAEPEIELRAPDLVTVRGFLRSASGRPCGAKDPLGRRASPLTPVGPRRLQATRAEGWRRGCRLILGDRRSEFRPHFAADSHDNGHNNGGEHQAHQTSHKSAHRHSDIPKAGRYPHPTDRPSWRR